MRTITGLLILLATPLTALGQTLLIENATLASPAGIAAERVDILIRDGLIVSIGEQERGSSQAQTIDAAGRFVTPGLMAGATQLGLVDLRGSPDGNDARLSSGSFGAEFDVSLALNANSTTLAVARAEGLTRAMSFPGGTANPPFTGAGVVLRLEDSIDIIDRARGAVFTDIGAFSKTEAGGSRAAQWLLLKKAIIDARAVGAGDRATQASKTKSVTALASVVTGNTPLVVSTNRASDIRQAIALSRDANIKVVILGGAEAWQVRESLAAAKIPVILDPMLNEPEDLDSRGARLDNAALLHDAGVLIAFVVYGSGVDLTNNVGLALRTGAGVAVANGLPYEEGLRAISSNPAKIWGIDTHYGTLTAGRDADIVIWDGDPLEPSSAPAMVMVRGQVVSLDNRQKQLAKRYHPQHRNPMPPAYR